MRSNLRALSGVLVLTALVANESIAKTSYHAFPFVREIQRASRHSGWTEVVVDSALYAQLDPGLGNLRIRDERGEEVPWFLESPSPLSWAEVAVPGTILDRSYVRGEHASVVLDLGERHPPVNRLVITTDGEEFRRRVVVEGRDRAEARSGRRGRDRASETWRTLRDDGYIYRMSAEGTVKNDTVSIPSTTYRQLRITVMEDPAGDVPIQIQAAAALRREETKRQEQEFRARVRRQEDNDGESIYALDFGASNLPIDRILLTVDGANYLRSVSVYDGSPEHDPTLSRPGLRKLRVTRLLGSGEIHSLQIAGAESLRVASNTDISISRPTTPRLRLVVRNLDNPPIDVTDAVGSGPIEKILFLAERGGSYRVYFGGHNVRAPDYDLAEVASRAGVAKPGSGGPPRAAATLGPASPNPEFEDPARSERRKVTALWISMVVSIVALALVLLLVFRRARGVETTA